MTVMEQIKAIEGALGSQAKAARMAGVKRNTWWRWSSGYQNLETPRTHRTRILIGLLYAKIFRSR